MKIETVVYKYVDDFTGKPVEDATTVKFSVGGTTYELDLGPASEEKFDKALAPWVAKARKVRGTRKARSKARSRSVAYTRRKSRKEVLKPVRDWAAKNKLDIPDRGRIPERVMEAYRASH